jgi:hypothetical protein
LLHGLGQQLIVVEGPAAHPAATEVIRSDPFQGSIDLLKQAYEILCFTNFRDRRCQGVTAMPKLPPQVVH